MSNCIETELNCSGCGVCSAICPTTAIKIALNEDGFYSAILDKTKCINCEKCLQVCTKFETNYSESKEFSEIPLYAGWSLDKKNQHETSSGGIAFEIARWGIKHNYKVAGVIYDTREKIAKTLIASSLYEIEDFKGSKYLQSFSADAFRQIINSNDKFVVFGTPCQIAGLKMSAKENNCENRLVLVDLFCHGVPSYLLWESFLKWLKEKFSIDQIKNIQFRNKKYGWHNYTMQINSSIPFYLKMKNNPFYTLFFSDLLLNNSCYMCKPKASFDFADIRLGDFWGSVFDNKEEGVSVISVFSDIGKSILDSLEKAGNIVLLPQNHTVCIKNQISLKKSSFNLYKERQLLFDLFKNGACILKIQKEYFKNLSFRKNIFLTIKKITPDYIINKFRKLYNYYRGM